MENVISNLDYFEIISKYLFTDDITNVNKIFPNLNYYPPDGEEINDFYASQENINKLKGKRIKSLEIIKADENINWDGVYIEILYVDTDLESIPCLNTLYYGYDIYVNCDKPVKKLYIYNDPFFGKQTYLYLNLGNEKNTGINLRCIDGNEIITEKIFIKDLSFDRLEDFKKLPLSNIFYLRCDFYNEIFESLNNLIEFITSAEIINTVPKAKIVTFENNTVCNIIPAGVEEINCFYNYKIIINEIVKPDEIYSIYGNIIYDLQKFENIELLTYNICSEKDFYDLTNFKKLTYLTVIIFCDISDFTIKINNNVSVGFNSKKLYKIVEDNEQGIVKFIKS